jgi:hypothetical protein
MFKSLIILIITIIISLEINTQIIERIYDQHNDKTVSTSFLSTNIIKSLKRYDTGECLSICSNTNGCESVVVTTNSDNDKVKKDCHLLEGLIDAQTDLVFSVDSTTYSKYGNYLFLF